MQDQKRLFSDQNNRALIMGILNVTPDSFSDGNLFYEKDKAVSHVLTMIEDGADIIDIGGESTRPFSEPVSLEEELKRVVPVIEEISKKVDIPISIDTYKAEVAKRAIKAGASIINDISALRFDPEMVKVVADNDVYVVLMHMKGTPQDMQVDPYYDNVVLEIFEFFKERVDFAISSGIERDKVIIDPGIGFGKRLEDNLALINNLDKFKELNLPILLGTSRKSFIGRILDREVGERDIGTAATLSVGIMRGANILRVHNVKMAYDITRMTEAILSSNRL